MQIQEIIQGKIVELVLAGKLDIDQLEKLEKTVTGHINNTQVQSVILNIKSLEYIDSSGMGILIRLLNQAKAKKKELLLSETPEKIMQIFQIARLDKFFNFKSAATHRHLEPDDEIDELLKDL